MVGSYLPLNVNSHLKGTNVCNIMHEGPFNFVNYRYTEVVKTLEQEVEEFIKATIGGFPDNYHTNTSMVPTRQSP